MVTAGDLVLIGAEKIGDVADNPRAEARILLSHATHQRVSDILIHPEKAVSEDEKSMFLSFVNMRASCKPIAYITGEKDFFGMTFKVNEHTLIPRPETEMIVEEIILSGKKKLLDLCTGSGCIPIAAAANSNVTALGVDISAGAVKIAEINAQNHGLKGRVSFEVCDIFEKDCFGKFDIITSNPPYITDEDMLTLPPDVADFEPLSALAGGEDGLKFYRRIVEIAPQNLMPDGLLIFEIGYDEGEAVASLMETDFTDIKIKKDLAGIDRVVTGRIK